ncbi:MAG: hypothetical protein WEB55_05055, partial [Acidimicrobiia bacterium]
ADLDPADRRVTFLVARLPEGQDPADLLDDGGRSFQESLTKAVPLEQHLIDEIVRQHNLEEPEAVARALRAAAAVAVAVDPNDRARTIEYSATRIGRDEAVVRTCLDAHGSVPRQSRVHEQARSI